MSKASEKPRPHAPSFFYFFTAIIFFLIYLPLAILVIFSFYDPLADRPWSFAAYESLINDRMLLRSFWVSFWVAFWSTLFSAIIGTAIALSLERKQFLGRKLFEFMNLVPLVMPEIVMGLSLLVWFGLIQQALQFVGINFSLGVFTLILAHITFCLAYVVITVQARLKDFDRSLEEAAQDLGATPWQSFWKVTFPTIWPGILAGSLLAFTISFDDFIVSFFTTGIGTDPLPVKLYSMIRFGVSPVINAASTLILLMTAVLVVFSLRVGTRKRAKS